MDEYTRANCGNQLSSYLAERIPIRTPMPKATIVAEIARSTVAGSLAAMK